jgi:glycosyltransferase involved in cell wall biosynthesis
MSVSVVIPTYNHRDYVVRTLESVFAQTAPAAEVIVVNDGSPDDTADVLRPFAADGRIRYIEQKNAGQAAARNRGFAEARGEFVAFLDDDDEWPADKLQWQADALRAAPDAVLVYGSFRLIRDGRLQPQDPMSRPAGRVAREFRQQCWIMSPGQTLMRAAAVRELGGFDTGIWGSDDWDLYIRLAARGTFLYEDRVALHYRQHAANASGRALEHVKNHLKVVRRHIGWNLPLLVSHQRAAARYFGPKLRDFAHLSRTAGRYGDAARAQLLALTFTPTLALRKQWFVPFVRNCLRLPPRATAPNAAGTAAAKPADTSTAPAATPPTTTPTAPTTPTSAPEPRG